MQKISSEQYLRNYVRDEDYNLYLLHFFASRIHRSEILSLMGLHCELRSIPKKVQDTHMMLVRLQWWRDEIAKDNRSDSPILDSLPTLNYDDYLNRFYQSLRGEQIDIDEAFYALMTATIKDEKTKNKFIKKLMRHDQLDEHAKFRALRLWLNI